MDTVTGDLRAGTYGETGGDAPDRSGITANTLTVLGPHQDPKILRAEDVFSVNRDQVRLAYIVNRPN
ncbi:MAG: hypothetical protein H0U51_03205 [Propionibacteriales bacterium]|nr:hypothetical protein [Propionibacteriales bacterium]